MMGLGMKISLSMSSTTWEDEPVAVPEGWNCKCVEVGPFSIKLDKSEDGLSWVKNPIIYIVIVIV